MPAWPKSQHKDPRSGTPRKCSALCKRCGQRTPPKPPSQGRQFCSVACARADWHERWQRHRGQCKQCDGPVKYRGCRFCSLSCATRYRMKHMPPRRRGPRRAVSRPLKPRPACGHCGQPVKWPTNKFCSRACLSAHRASRCRREQQRPCDACGTLFVASLKHLKKARFCSSRCCAQFFTGDRHPLWRGGSRSYRGVGWKRLAAAIRRRDDDRCRCCGKSQTENGTTLAVDHIRPWRSFDDKHQANHPDNLVTLCGACHARKTTVAERQWLRGDVLAFRQFERNVADPSR